MKTIKEQLEEIEKDNLTDQYFDLTKNAVSFEELQDIINSFVELIRIENITYH